MIWKKIPFYIFKKIVFKKLFYYFNSLMTDHFKNNFNFFK